MPRAIRVLAGLLVFCSAMLLAVSDSTAENSPTSENEAKPVLALSIRCNEAALKAGDEIPITFVITNEGQNPCRYEDPNSDLASRMEYALSATNENGEAVPDPLAKRGLLVEEGPPVRMATLGPGQSFTKIIALNRWALITQSGTYRVVGTYYCTGNRPAIMSPPISITIRPRTDEEMAAYIRGLCTQLTANALHRVGAYEFCHDVYFFLLFVVGCFSICPRGTKAIYVQSLRLNTV